MMKGHGQSKASATEENSPTGGDYNPEANHKRQVKSGLGHKNPGDFAYGDNSFENSGSHSKAA